MYKKLLILFLCMVLLSLNLNVAVFADKTDVTTLYVSPQGSDSNDGSVDRPFKTPEKARDTLRALRAVGEVGTGGSVVYFREGSYNVSESIVLTAEDSGTAAAPALYRAYPGEKPVFVGGKALPANQFSKTTDKNILDRIIDAKAKDSIYEINLFTQLGLKEIPLPALPGAYSAPTLSKNNSLVRELMEEFSIKASDSDMELIVDQSQMTIAKYPNNGYMTVQKAGPSFPLWFGVPADMPATQKLDKWRELPVDERETITFTPSDMRSRQWKNAENALMWGKFEYEWADETIPVKSANTETGEIIGAFPTAIRRITPGKPFYVYNLIEELDSPSEYFIDRQTGILYFYPPGNIKDMDIFLSMLDEPVFSVEGASHITLKNLAVTTSKNSAVSVKGGEHVIVDGFDISYTQIRAATFEGGSHNGIKNSYIHDVDGGVFIEAGDTENLVRAENYVENCHIERFQRIKKTYNVAVQLNGVGNRASYNTINTCGHSALGFVGQYHTIEYNELYDFDGTVDDMGIIYAGRTFTSRGNKIVYNYIHDVTSETNGSNGVHGIYLDDGFSGGVIAGNVFENISGYGVMLTGRDVTVTNNIFVNMGRSVAFMDFRSMDASVPGIYAKDWMWGSINKVPKNDVWRQAFPEIFDVIENPDSINPINVNNKITNNLCYRSPEIILHSSLPRNWGVYENNYFTSQNPGFYDLTNRNYLLKPDSAAFSKIEGFKPIPFTRMGNYSKRAMERISSAVTLSIGSPRAFVDGAIKAIDSQNPEIYPFISNEKTYVPLRFISEGMGAEIDYDENTGDITIKKEEDVIVLNTNSASATKNGAVINLDVQPEVIDGRTYVPLRSIGEMMSMEVFWDDTGFIAINGTEDLFDSEIDRNIIDYIRGLIN